MMTSEELFYSKKPAFDRTDWDKASEYAEGYKTFLDMGKTERDAVTATSNWRVRQDSRPISAVCR